MAKLGAFSGLFFGLGVALAPRLAWAASTELSPGANLGAADGGCGCRTSRSSGGFGFFAALLALGLLLSRRERR
jgi:MYXO-CTERM domain-containing protein